MDDGVRTAGKMKLSLKTMVIVTKMRVEEIEKKVEEIEKN